MQRTWRWLCGLIVLAISQAGFVAMIIQPQAVSLELLNFSQIPYTYTQSPTVFRQIFANAISQPVRVALFGDSQETSPGGAGTVYVPRVNYEMYLRYGQVSETKVMSNGSTGSGSPPADWLVSSSGSIPVQSPPTIQNVSTYVLPSMSIIGHSTKNGGININGENYGQLDVLRKDALLVAAGAGIPTTNDYFCLGATVGAELFAITYQVSGELTVRMLPTNATTNNYFATLAGTQTSAIGLESPVRAIKTWALSGIPMNGFLYQQLEVNGSENSKLTNFIGLRYISESCSQGVVVNTFSAGGYTADSVLANHGNSGPLLAAIGPHVAWLHFGANGIGGVAFTAVAYQARLQQLIQFIRTAVGNPSFPVILSADIYRTGIATADRIAQYDLYTGAAYNIARVDPNVMLLNSRRLMDDIGLNANNPAVVAAMLTDGVHYTDLGAQTLAQLEIETLYAAVQ